MNYIGSKLSLLPFIEQGVEKVIPKELQSNATFCDLFAGTGVVGTHFKKRNYTVYSNDIQYYSYVLIKHYIENNHELRFDSLTKILPELTELDITNRISFICNFLNNLSPKEGFIYKNYCLGGTKGCEHERLYFTDENGLKCDSIRQTIQEWFDHNYITSNEYFYLLAILLKAIDKVANTASIYEAFLKKYKKSALKSLTLHPLPIIINDCSNKVFNKDINSLINNISGDILYLDPPYNRRQYSSNYHILETIAKYDTPKIKGKTGVRDNTTQKSLYSSKVNAKKAFEDLIYKAKFKYIFVSYNDEGIISLDDIEKIMSKRGMYGRFEQPYRRYKADNNRNYKKTETLEYLHYVVTK